jgi:uncharacterized membrane protein YfcA
MSMFAFSFATFLAATAVTLAASFVKGAVGFAMPMIMISGLASFMPAEQALATLIIPTLLANLWQGLRGGLPQVKSVLHEFRLYLVVVLVVIALSAQLVTLLPPGALYLVLGVPIIGFSALQLLGWAPHVPPARRWVADVGIGGLAGLSGGLAGVWGPPTVLYLTAINAAKGRAIAMQGVVYGAGAVVLLLSHLRSGLLNADTIPLSLAMVAPMVVGLWVGQAVQDRLDQRRFRRAMLVVLVLVALNLIRRGLADMGVTG